MQKVQEVQEKSVEEEKDKYVLSWKSNHKMMHCLIKIENATALIESYMRKPEHDVYHLTRALQNPKTNLRRDKPESLSWYHGTVDNKVSFRHFFIILSFIRFSKRTSQLLRREPAGKYLLRKNDKGLFRLSYKSDQTKVFFRIKYFFFYFT